MLLMVLKIWPFSCVIVSKGQCLQREVKTLWMQTFGSFNQNYIGMKMLVNLCFEGRTGKPTDSLGEFGKRLSRMAPKKPGEQGAGEGQPGIPVMPN